MKHATRWGLLALLACGLRVAGAPLAYVVDASDQFGIIDAGTGVFSFIGNTGVDLNDLTRSPSGALYTTEATFESTLRTLDPATGLTAIVGLPGHPLGTIAFSSDGRLFGEDGSALFSLNPVTAQASLVGPYGLSAPFISASLIFDSQNQLFVAGISDIFSTALLYRVDTASGQATLVGDTGFQILTLLAVPNQLYGFTTSGEIVTINESTGLATLRRFQDPTLDLVFGAVPINDIPEPGTFILVSGGITVAIAARKVRVLFR